MIFRWNWDMEITGWPMGLDDYHYVIATQAAEVVLVHKSCPMVRISWQRISDIPVSAARDKVSDLTEGFRNYVMQHVYSHTPATKESR